MTIVYKELQPENQLPKTYIKHFYILRVSLFVKLTISIIFKMAMIPHSTPILELQFAQNKSFRNCGFRREVRKVQRVNK